jgi:hypothetical protein
LLSGVRRTASELWNLTAAGREGLVDWKTARARAARSRFLGTWGGIVKKCENGMRIQEYVDERSGGCGAQVFIKQ